MKWIGEHVWDLISRFRGDVYIESVPDGTVASDKFLGLDSNNKLVKETVTSGGGDITGVTAGTGLSGGGSSGDVTLSVDASQTQITAVGTIATGTWEGTDVGVEHGGTGLSTVGTNEILTGNGTGALTSESALTFDGDNLEINGTGIGEPAVRLRSLANHISGGQLLFLKDRTGGTASDGDIIGQIIFQGDDASGNALQTYASIYGYIKEADHGSEGGKLQLSVATHDGENQPGLIIEDGSAEDEVDVTIANGASSLTTVAGDLTTTQDLNANNLTLLDTVDNTSSSSSIYFQKDTGANAVDNQAVGTIYYTGENDIQETITYVAAIGQVSDASDGAEKGEYALGVRSGGAVISGLRLIGGDTGSEVDVSIGAASTSVTSVAGKLDVGNGLDITGDLDITGAMSVSGRITAKQYGLAGPVVLDHAYVSATGRSQGTIVYFGGTTSMTAGKVYYFKGDGTWGLALADDPSTSTGLLGIALGASSDSDGMLLQGVSMLAADDGDIGEIAYIHASTAGRSAGTAPSSSGDVVRVIGHYLGNTDKKIYFNPSNSWVEIA